MTEPKIVSVSIPEYTIEIQPDYQFVGDKIDKAVAENFEGVYLVRALSIADHPQLTLDELIRIILKTGTDKYDSNRKGVAQEEFEPYKPDIQAGMITASNGKLDKPFADDIRRFYENTLIDRGYRLRIDLLVLYNPELLVRAEKIDNTKPNVATHLEEYLWRFKDSDQKQNAVVGVVKIL